MKIAVTHNNGEIFQHFGKSEQFKIYCIENNKIISSEVVDTNGTGHGALAGFLKDRGVEAIICGGIGSGAVNALADAGIKVYGGVSGNAGRGAQGDSRGPHGFPACSRGTGRRTAAGGAYRHAAAH